MIPPLEQAHMQDSSQNVPTTSAPKGWKAYRKILKEEGVKGLVQKAGWKVAVLVFLFFLVKGLAWLAVPYLIAKGLLR